MRAGTAGDNANRAVVQELLATPDWGHLAVPLVRAVQNIVQLSSLVKGGFPNCVYLGMVTVLPMHVDCKFLCMPAVRP